MNEKTTVVMDAKARIEEALTALQGSPVVPAVGIPVTTALKVARARIDRLETLQEDRFNVRDKCAMNLVTHLMVYGNHEPKEAVALAYVLADEAMEARRHVPV